MRTHKRIFRGLSLGAMLVGFATLFGSSGAGWIPTVSAQEPAPRERKQGSATVFGMQTLAPRQTAQIMVVNPSEMIPCVRVRLAFDLFEQDATDSGSLHFVRSITREVELEPGEAASLEYTAGGRGAFVSPITLVREINEVGDPHAPRAALAPQVRTRAVGAMTTLTINEKGTVIFIPPGVRVGFDPQPDPPAN
jgi:hypothetical protein